MFGAGEQDIQLPPAAIWVHLTYQSAFVDDAGKLQTRRDVYNIDGRLIAAAPPAMSFFQSLFFGGRPPRPSRGIYW
jgi:murein L,D-transpeptidase YcbB/YkuD